MPLFEVVVSETVRETVEELHVAYRDAFYSVVYEVEADNEEEARDNYYQGDRRNEEFIDYGDYYDSEFLETLDVTDTETLEEDVEEITELSDEVLQRRLDERRRWEEQLNVMSRSIFRATARPVAPAPPPTSKPAWEV